MFCLKNKTYSKCIEKVKNVLLGIARTCHVLKKTKTLFILEYLEDDVDGYREGFSYDEGMKIVTQNLMNKKKLFGCKCRKFLPTLSSWQL